jgi:nitrate reductase gamma subunit
MVLNFPDYVSVDIIHNVGVATATAIVLIVLYEFIRWRGVLSPIAKGFKLGAARWWSILIDTVVKEVVYQQIEMTCGRLKWFSHVLIFWGFLFLVGSTTVDYLTNPTGGPLPPMTIVRVLGNLGGIMLASGLAIVIYRIARDENKRSYTISADYFFIGLLGFATATGFATEFVAEINAVSWVYAVYVVHLLTSGALLLLAPFTKFIHVLGRPVMRLSERYLEALGRAGLVKPAEFTVTPLLDEE